MSGSTFGHLFRGTNFGASHGPPRGHALESVQDPLQ